MGKKSRRQRTGPLQKATAPNINDLDVPALVAFLDDEDVALIGPAAIAAAKSGQTVDVSVGGVTDKSTFRSRASWSAAGAATRDTVLKSVSAKTGQRTRRNARHEPSSRRRALGKFC